MRRAVVVANERAAHQVSWGSAFADGMRRHGWAVDVKKLGYRASNCDLVAMWSVRDVAGIEAAKAAGAEVVILERGYIGDRKFWTSVSKGGGLNGYGVFGPCQDTGERFRSVAGLKPWNDGRGCALIMGQVPGDMSVRRYNLPVVYQEAAAECRALGYDVQFRPHPGGAVVVPGVKNRPSGESLEDALAAAAFVVTVNSNSGVDAALAGVPVVALDRGSMAWKVASQDIAKLKRPVRSKWAAHLAWKQWNREEIANGDAWAALEAV